ncbi:unnamed protein product [Lactuca saligna]|uniref:Uncharacterized protein n=1 Tax=Lactuca saligna TaxID=75948 RepID=A0AA35YXZ3_LACSI|nr:unnamed protein product [Lactuca saligna]
MVLFPKGYCTCTSRTLDAKLEIMKKRRVHVPAFIDWHWIGQKGLMDAMDPYLDKLFNGFHGQFMCLGWRRISEIQEVVSKELVYEFLTKVYFARKYGIYDDDNLTFSLGGERCSLSLTDFALRTRIYLPSEVHTELYQQLIAAASIRNIEWL